MAVLNETARAVSNLKGNFPQYGNHLSTSIGIGETGILVGEEMFDADIHEVSDIDPLSLTGFALGEDFNFVNQEIPFRAMDMRVVVESDLGQSRMDWLRPVEKAKEDAARSFIDTLYRVKNPEDLLSLYVIGSKENSEAFGPRAIFEQTEDPEDNADAIADLCRKGLNIVISNFELPIRRERHDFSRTLGIKINHERELQLLPNTGFWSMGGIEDVDTHKRKQLVHANERLAIKHTAITDRLQKAGMQVVQIAVNGKGVDWQSYDERIARAVEKIN